MYKLDSISEDCILGSEFLDRVSPNSVDTKKMNFTCILNNQSISLPISFNASHKCQALVHNLVSKPNPAQLSNMDRCKEFSDIHGEKMPAEISEKIKKDCCAENLNAFWKQEKYFVSLPLDQQ